MLSERALCSRINRKLAQMDPWCVLKKTRGGQAWLDLGAYYLLNVRQNLIDEKDVNLWDLGVKLKVISKAEVEQAMHEIGF